MSDSQNTTQEAGAAPESPSVEPLPNYPQEINNLWSMVHAQQRQIDNLHSTVTDVRVDLTAGISSVRALCEAQYKQIEDKFATLSGMISKLESGQVALLAVVERQAGAEEERARTRRNFLEESRMKADAALAEAAKNSAQLAKYKKMSLRWKFIFWACTVVIFGLLGVVVKISSVDAALSREGVSIWRRLPHESHYTPPGFPFNKDCYHLILPYPPHDGGGTPLNRHVLQPFISPNERSMAADSEDYEYERIGHGRRTKSI